MSFESIINQVIQEAVKAILPVFISEGVVISVDESANTCDVSREGMPDLHNVRLNAVLKAGKDVITVYPSPGSKVICILIENQHTDAFVISCTDIEKITAEIQGQKIEYTKTGIILNDGKIGGLVKQDELKTQLSVMTARIDGIINALNAGTPATGAPDSGAVLIASIKASLATIVRKENFNDIEDSNIKH